MTSSCPAAAAAEEREKESEREIVGRAKMLMRAVGCRLVDLRTGRTVSRVADYRAIRSLPVSAAARARDPSNRNSRRQGVEPVVTNTSIRQDTGRDFRFRQWSVRSASLFKSRRDCVQINARRVRTSRENVLVATITIVL